MDPPLGRKPEMVGIIHQCIVKALNIVESLLQAPWLVILGDDVERPDDVTFAAARNLCRRPPLDLDLPQLHRIDLCLGLGLRFWPRHAW